MTYTYIAVKLVTGFFGLWIMTRLLGKKEISQLTPFDFVTSLMLSELVGNTVYDREVTWSELIFALTLWMALSLALEKAMQLFPWLSRPLSGRPDIVIRDGRIDEAALKRNKLDMHQLGMLLREQNVFSVQEVACAIFETNGNLSVLLASSADTVKREDLGLAPKPAQMTYILIDHGCIEHEVLKEIGRDERWLHKQLQARGAARPDDVLYVEWSADGGLHMQLRQEKQAAGPTAAG
ncbi:uncharacterized membrane protein YcaP (DUF421 family) [Paenibacillus phyllosphaerae]|uniref:Uncharacterized membrane protein YcaP (DUF421 family) n=1 Tax=Paenibacillus phyllosphaerae TaxID=274593 RepID=A0A7W5FPH8_9BACL|nr:DUF421 domain-containing protein [Paenibacillus phyllosphaerae]MBB3112242.1 uncharacterized membrane protein YcaP (DUF421 family) [Paenibacillus phyllosphaerae]